MQQRHTLKCSAENRPLIEKADHYDVEAGYNKWKAEMLKEEAEDYTAKANTLREQAQCSLPANVD